MTAREPIILAVYFQDINWLFQSNFLYAIHQGLNLILVITACPAKRPSDCSNGQIHEVSSFVGIGLGIQLPAVLFCCLLTASHASRRYTTASLPRRQTGGRSNSEHMIEIAELQVRCGHVCGQVSTLNVVGVSSFRGTEAFCSQLHRQRMDSLQIQRGKQHEKSYLRRV